MYECCGAPLDPAYRSGMREAVLFDIHGNIDALEAVLVDAREAGCEGLLLGGDYALLGPAPDDVVDLLRAQPGSVRAIRGNTDRMILWYEGDEARWAADRLGDERVQWLRNMPEQLALPEHDALLVHATPRSDEERLKRTYSNARVASMLADVTQSTLLCGHIHKQYRRQVGSIEVVNPGAVGFPYDGKKSAAWAIIDDGEIELRRTKYNVKRALARLEAIPSKPERSLAIRRLRTAHS